ncbi:MAG: hypothetical protein GWN55_06470 [Phycisphaerae bacterium]|nr:hypothetical protein [Phycisphaerae bacterium]
MKHQLDRLTMSISFLTILMRLAFMVALGGLWTLQPGVRAAPVAGLVIYDDAMASGWQVWPWDTGVDFTHGWVYSGTSSIAITFNTAWAGFSVRALVPVDTSPTPPSPSGFTVA